MAEPDRRDIRPEDLDDKGLDRRGLADTLRAINKAIDEMSEQRQRLGEVVVEGRSRDGEVAVQVTRVGRLKQVRLRDGVTRRYDLDALGRLVTDIIRDTQRRARVEYERAVEQIPMPTFVVTERGLRRHPPEHPTNS